MPFPWKQPENAGYVSARPLNSTSLFPASGFDSSTSTFEVPSADGPVPATFPWQKPRNIGDGSAKPGNLIAIPLFDGGTTLPASLRTL